MSQSGVRPRSRVKLACGSGPLAGQEFVLSGKEVILGRATDAAISIPDTSVSRRHVLLRQVNGSWTVSDMGSGNGTLINGEPVSDETPLHHGDVLTLGDTELTFLVASGVAPLSPASSPSSSGSALKPRSLAPLPPAVRSRTMTRSRAIRVSRGFSVDPVAAQRRRRVYRIIGGVVAVAMLLLVGLRVEQLRRAEAEKRKAREIAAERQRVEMVFQDGKNLVREGRWREAKIKFEAVRKSAPDFPSLKEYLTRAEREIPFQERLEAAEAAIERQQLAEASKALSEVASDTNQFTLLQSLKRRLDDLRGKKVAAGRQAVLGGDLRQVEKARELKALAEDVLSAFPDDRDAQELNERATAALAELTRPRPVAAPVGPKPWEEVASKWASGDAEGAMQAASRCSEPLCRTKLEQIKRIGERAKEIDRLTPRELEDLLRQDETLGGGRRSPVGVQLGRRVAASNFRTAASAKTVGDWARAVEFALKTLWGDSAHAGAQAIVTEIREKAKRAFELGYLAKDSSPDEAIQHFRDCMGMTSPNDEQHAKCRNWLQKLAR